MAFHAAGRYSDAQGHCPHFLCPTLWTTHERPVYVFDTKGKFSFDQNQGIAFGQWENTAFAMRINTEFLAGGNRPTIRSVNP
jgi:hypothetical protein